MTGRISRSRHDIRILLLLTVAACDASGPAPAVSVVERDSAGIAILDVQIDTVAIRVGWGMTAEADLVIGGLDAPESQQLFRVSGARRLRDGRVVVADGGSSEIRLYDAGGSLIATHGRRGEGPGEFKNPSLVGVLAGEDSLVVYDGDLRRVSILHADSGFARSYPVGSEGGGFPVAIGLASDGSMAFGGGMYFSSEGGGFPPSGAMRPNSRYVLLTPSGTIRGDWGEVPAAEMFSRNDGTSFSASALPFGRVTAAAVGADRFWLGTGDGWEVRAYSLDATLVRILRVSLPLAPVTDALQEAELAERLEDASDDNEARQIRSTMASMPMPEVVPPYQLFRIDALDHLWVGEYRLPGVPHRDFVIFDSAGRAVGRASMPPRTLPLDIGVDYILGLTRGAFDVEQLTLWGLERPMEASGRR